MNQLSKIPIVFLLFLALFEKLEAQEYEKDFSRSERNLSFQAYYNRGILPISNSFAEYQGIIIDQSGNVLGVGTQSYQFLSGYTLEPAVLNIQVLNKLYFETSLFYNYSLLDFDGNIGYNAANRVSNVELNNLGFFLGPMVNFDLHKKWYSQALLKYGVSYVGIQTKQFTATSKVAQSYFIGARLGYRYESRNHIMVQIGYFSAEPIESEFFSRVNTRILNIGIGFSLDI